MIAEHVSEDEPMIGWRVWVLGGHPEEPRLQSMAWNTRFGWPGGGKPVGPDAFGFNAFEDEQPARNMALTCYPWGQVKLWGRVRPSLYEGTWPLILGEYAYPLSVEVPLNPDAIVTEAFATETWAPANAEQVMAALREAYPGVEFTEKWYRTPDHVDKAEHLARQRADAQSRWMP